MARKYLTLFCALLVVSLTMATRVERRCVEGRSYFDGCNNCFCSNGNVACTLMACQSEDPKTGEMRDIIPLQPPEDFWQPITNIDPPRI
ncbi:uncharacterized protein LOC135167380 [Diachasmimorpha longicaudata]|uniref:uncharacterized protein LOC135167380 n=1 Tax=Diachasmimorpha longicaudata TaxID=58733 RepID=UPI0030B8EA1B